MPKAKKTGVTGMKQTTGSIKLGVIGIGQMGNALLQGILSAKLFPPSDILGYDKDNEKNKIAGKRLGIRTCKENKEVAKGSDVLLLAVKPQNMTGVLLDISPALDERALLISIAAGFRVRAILDGLNRKAKVIRAMPNIAVLAAQGASALFSGPGVTQDNEAIALKIFGTVGKAILVRDESLLDAVTGLSGSGPAYIFLVLEALSDAGVRMGLTREMATTLAIQTLLGAAHMAQTTAKSFSELKDMVTSPGGTTIEGLKKLEERRVRAAFMEAVEAATIKAKQLSSG